MKPSISDRRDELVVQKILTEMIQEERWELTDLGRQRLQAVNGNGHQHRLVIWPFGKKGEPDDCVDPMHMRSDGSPYGAASAATASAEAASRSIPATTPSRS